MKETPASGGKTQTKKSGKKQSENEAFKKRMREMYVAVEKYQVLDRMFTTYLEDVIQCSQ
jgi:hypothetical protein